MLSWLGREDVVLIGHSLGAAVALDHASRFAATRGLVMIDLARGGTPGGGRRARLALSLRRTYRTREEAIARLDRALEEYDIQGIATSISFHRKALRQPEFVSGRYTTDFVETVRKRDRSG